MEAEKTRLTDRLDAVSYIFYFLFTIYIIPCLVSLVSLGESVGDGVLDVPYVRHMPVSPGAMWASRPTGYGSVLDVPLWNCLEQHPLFCYNTINHEALAVVKLMKMEEYECRKDG